MPHREPTGDLAYRALRYAAGELDGAEADAFEVSLANDEAAREALGESVRLSTAVAGGALPAPPSDTFFAIRDRLLPTPLSRLFPIRSYRGHPALWVGLGIFAAGSVALAWELTPAPVATSIVIGPLAVEPPATSAEAVPSTTPVAGMEPAPPEPMVVPPMPMGQPRVEVPPVPTGTKKG